MGLKEDWKALEGVDVGPRKKEIKIIEYVNAPKEMSAHDVKELVERALNTPGAKVSFLENVSGLGDTCLLWTGDGTTEEARSALEEFIRKWVGPDGIGDFKKE